MRGKVVGVFCAGLAVVVAGAGSAGAAAEDRIPAVGASTSAAESCAASFPPDALTRAASEATVAPGQPIAVDVTWRPAWHSSDRVDVLGCVAANATFVDGTVERGIANRGLWVHKFAVPLTAAEHILVCEAAIVMGPGANGAPQAERTDPDCFTVGATAEKAPSAPAPATPDAGTAQAKDPIAAPRAAPSSPPPVAVPAVSTPPRTAAAAPSAPTNPGVTTAKPASQLPHTGTRDDSLALLAGILLVVGGSGIVAGAKSRPKLRSS